MNKRYYGFAFACISFRQTFLSPILNNLKNSKYWDWQVWANSADLDQTVPDVAVWSGSVLFAIP